jgi:outer membrane protein TolC
LIWFLFQPSTVLSQIGFTSLIALIDSADQHLPALLAKKAEYNSATANITDTRHQFLPAFRFSDQVNLGTDNSLSGSYFPYGLIPSTSGGIRAANDLQTASGNLAVLYGEYDLVDFGYKNARIDQARTNAAFKSADYQRETYLLHAQLSREYFNLLSGLMKLEVERQTVSRYDTIFQMIRALTLSGLRPGSDSSLAKAELSKSRITYNQIHEQAINSREELSYLTGISVDKIIPDSSILAGTGGRKVGNIRSDIEPNPLINYYSYLRNAYVSSERLISKSFLPRILLTAATWVRGSSIVYEDQYKDVGMGFGYQRYNWLAGISFQYDLFGGIHKKDKLRSFGFERESVELQLQQQELSLFSASRQAQHSIEIAERNLVEMPIQYQAALDTYNQKLAQYKAGIIALIDLTNAAFVLDRSENDYVQTLGSWYQAQLEKAIASGTLNSFILSIR